MRWLLLAIPILIGCPGASEVEGPEPTPAEDRDGDGISYLDGDCDPTDARVYPGAEEVCDGLDNDCDDDVDEGFDADGDGYLPVDCNGEDCDDTSALAHPGADEACDGADTDCDGDLPEWERHDFDDDGIPFCADCSDLHPSIGTEDPCPEFWDTTDTFAPGWAPLLSPAWLTEAPGVGAITPGFDIDYWELRIADDWNWPPLAIISEGSLCEGAADPPACELEFGALDTPTSFGAPSCMPSTCWRQIAWTAGDEMALVGAVELLKFVGNVDTPFELALWLDRNWYVWGYGLPDGGRVGRHRAIDGGWEAVVEELVFVSNGHRVDLVHVEVGLDGELNELDRWIQHTCFDCVF